MSYSKKEEEKNAAKNGADSTLTETTLALICLKGSVGKAASSALKKRHDPFWAEF